MKVFGISFSLACLLVIGAASLLGAEEGDPAWVDYEKGKLALAEKDYGRAVLFFKQALERAKVLPEAEIGLGDAYFFAGDYAVAERQFLRAYEQRIAFLVPDMQYETLYRLARLYKLNRDFGKMEETLKRLVQDDMLYSSADQAFFRQNLTALFKNKGFDAMFLLNRFNESFSTAAHAELAEYYYKTHNFEIALDYGLFGIIPLVTEGMLEIRKAQYDYRFTTLDDFLREGLALEAVRDYLQERDFFRRLYYLALVCIEKRPFGENGRILLRTLAAQDAAGEYQSLAGRQYKRYTREKSILDTTNIEMP